MFKILIRFFVLSFLSINIFAETLICPQTITSTNYEEGICDIPKGFHINLERLRGSVNNAKFSGEIILNLEYISAWPLSFFEKKVTGKSFILYCGYEGKGISNNEAHNYDTFFLPISTYVNSLNFISQRTWGFGGVFGTQCLSKNPEDCFGLN
jgi:hypothetical protein